MFILTHNRSAKGHKATKMRRESNYPTIKNFFRLTVLSCCLKAFTDEAVTTVNSITQTVPRKYNSVCIKIFRSVCIAARLKKFTTVAKVLLSLVSASTYSKFKEKKKKKRRPSSCHATALHIVMRRVSN